MVLLAVVLLLMRVVRVPVMVMVIVGGASFDEYMRIVLSIVLDVMRPCHIMGPDPLLL